jgi:hypothetical protein
MVVIGLKAAGIDPVTDPRFLADGGDSLLDVLRLMPRRKTTASDSRTGPSTILRQSRRFWALIAAESGETADNVLDFSAHAAAPGTASQNEQGGGDNEGGDQPARAARSP